MTSLRRDLAYSPVQYLVSTAEKLCAVVEIMISCYVIDDLITTIYPSFMKQKVNRFGCWHGVSRRLAGVSNRPSLLQWHFLTW